MLSSLCDACVLIHIPVPKTQTLGAFDPVNYELVATLTGHAAAVYETAPVEGGTRLWACSADESVSLWDVSPAQALATGPEENPSFVRESWNRFEAEPRVGRQTPPPRSPSGGRPRSTPSPSGKARRFRLADLKRTGKTDAAQVSPPARSLRASGSQSPPVASPKSSPQALDGGSGSAPGLDTGGWNSSPSLSAAAGTSVGTSSERRQREAEAEATAALQAENVRLKADLDRLRRGPRTDNTGGAAEAPSPHSKLHATLASNYERVLREAEESHASEVARLEKELSHYKQNAKLRSVVSTLSHGSGQNRRLVASLGELKREGIVSFRGVCGHCFFFKKKGEGGGERGAPNPPARFIPNLTSFAFRSLPTRLQLPMPSTSEKLRKGTHV